MSTDFEMTTDFELSTVLYPVTHARRLTINRLAYLFGHFRLLQPPGLPHPTHEGLGNVVDLVEPALSPERRRTLDAVLADYLRWAADHQGGAYALYAQHRVRPQEETPQEVKRALRQEGRGLAAGQTELPPDISWQVLLRLAHDYDRQ
ncbi:MAG: hypothetical protein V2A77_00335 [Pseudomonadota bacterium]